MSTCFGAASCSLSTKDQVAVADEQDHVAEVQSVPARTLVASCSREGRGRGQRGRRGKGGATKEVNLGR